MGCLQHIGPCPLTHGGGGMEIVAALIAFWEQLMLPLLPHRLHDVDLCEAAPQLAVVRRTGLECQVAPTDRPRAETAHEVSTLVGSGPQGWEVEYCWCRSCQLLACFLLEMKNSYLNKRSHIFSLLVYASS